MTGSSRPVQAICFEQRRFKMNPAARLSDVATLSALARSHSDIPPRQAPSGPRRYHLLVNLLGKCSGGVVIGLGIVAAACALAASVTVAAAWIISAALSSDLNTHGRAPLEQETLALAKYYVASAADQSGPSWVSAAPADAREATFEATWARTTGSDAPYGQVKTEIARAPDWMRFPKLASVAAPASSPATLRLSPSISEQQHASLPPANRSMSLPAPDSRTAVYDIAAHTVYLPNGVRLEAHSGLGNKRDDPRYVRVKNRGPTPPNVYDLALRERMFHGVRALRLKPVGDDSMFGRDGILAHSYMLGPNGQSNGCVSFRDYPTFLRAVLRGEVDRLVVVPNLGSKRSRTDVASAGGINGNGTNNR
jgi:hypothetical protein